MPCLQPQHLTVSCPQQALKYLPSEVDRWVNRTDNKQSQFLFLLLALDYNPITLLRWCICPKWQTKIKFRKQEIKMSISVGNIYIVLSCSEQRNQKKEEEFYFSQFPQPLYSIIYYWSYDYYSRSFLSSFIFNMDHCLHTNIKLQSWFY